MFSYELLTSIVGNFVQINTHYEPRVETGKVILKEKLTKGEIK
jgi:glucose-6-phosphate isomerase